MCSSFRKIVSERAVEALGPEMAEVWLNKRNPDLYGRTPLEAADVCFGLTLYLLRIKAQKA